MAALQRLAVLTTLDFIGLLVRDLNAKLLEVQVNPEEFGLGRGEIPPRLPLPPRQCPSYPGLDHLKSVRRP